jgi:hypothetical protein
MHRVVMLSPMRSFRSVIEALGGAGATRNAMVAVDAHRVAMAEVDSAVARLHRHVVGKERPAA